ncbi:MAG: DUF3445 domain-containing protein [Candidatus Sericytochromatia bacterium]|nr:DUF3445 domain-containing protein [Candidatus Sericytochromatia bacterium]
MDTAVASPVDTAQSRYYPYENGKYEVKAGLTKLGAHPVHGVVESHVFMIDEHYRRYLTNKAKVHRTILHGHYLQAALSPVVRAVIPAFMAGKMAAEYPEVFTWEAERRILTNKLLGWSGQMDFESGTVTILSRQAAPLVDVMADIDPVDAIDFLALNVMEDFAFLARNPLTEDDWLSAVHISSPHYWDPRDKIGHSFAPVHRPVADAVPLMATASKIIRAAVEQGPFMRFAWGMAANDLMNHRPDAEHEGDRTQLGTETDAYWMTQFIRVERQTLTGFADLNTAFFTIRPYWYSLTDLMSEPERMRQLAAAMLTMSPAAMAYKGMTRTRDALVAFLERHSQP